MRALICAEGLEDMSFIVMNECALPKGYNHCPVATVMVHTRSLFWPQIVLITIVTGVVHFMKAKIDTRRTPPGGTLPSC